MNRIRPDVVGIVLSLIALLLPAVSFSASCYQWEFHTSNLEHDTGWITDPARTLPVIEASIVDDTLVGCGMQAGGPYSSCNISLTGKFPGYIAGGYCTRTNGSTRGFSCSVIGRRVNPDGCKVYVSALPDDTAACGPTCDSVGDPIAPASGNAHIAEADLVGGPIEFKRYYNSAGTAEETSAGGWRHSYSRRVVPVSSSTEYRPYSPGVDNSSLFNTETEACISGFAQIKSRVAAWATASADYSNGRCTVRVSGTAIARLSLFYQSPPTPAPGSTVVISYRAIRDDGQVLNFSVDGSAIAAPPGITFKLQQTAAGYTLTTPADDVEVYDATGRLLSVSSRDGTVRTMGYDAEGRLASVLNNFGQRLDIEYDSANRIRSVTRQ